MGQCNRTVKGTVYMSLTCESGQDASCVHAVVSHFPELTVVVSQKHITEV